MVDVPYDSALAPRRADETVESPMRRALRRLKRRKGAIVGLVVIVIFVMLAVFAPLIAPFDPAAQSWSAVRKAPSALYWFGTDDVGRDVLSRVIFGTRASLLAGVISVGIACLDRRAARAHRRLSRRLDRRAALAHHRRDARRPVPHSGDRARGVPRARASATR